MSTGIVSDPYAGTVYRDLHDADEALRMAQFRGSEDGIGYDAALAVAEIDTAIAALQTARAKLVASPKPVRVQAIEIYNRDRADRVGAAVRAFLGVDGIDWVAPRRSTLTEAQADAAEIARHGLHWYRISYLDHRPMRVRAGTANTANDLAIQRWGDKLGLPITVEYLGRIAPAEAVA